MDNLERMLNEVVSLLFPKTCDACGLAMNKQLEQICTACRMNLPQTNAHLSKNNPFEKLFWGRIELNKATAFFKFESKGGVQRLIHNLKYEGVKEIGHTLGKFSAQHLNQSSFFDSIDAIVPIPIHEKKEKVRGYNQSHFIADGISEILDIPAIKNAVKKEIHTESQTRKSRYNRWKNVKTTFKVTDSDVLKNKHLLLVDDVVTTGSTVEACGIELLKVEGVQLSFLAMAGTVL